MFYAVPFLVVLAMAFIVEGLTEYFAGRPFDNIPALTPHKWLLPYVAAVVGILGALFYSLDFFAMLRGALGEAAAPHPFGMALTGLAIARGSNFIHDLYAFVLAAVAKLKTSQ